MLKSAEIIKKEVLKKFEESSQAEKNAMYMRAKCLLASLRTEKGARLPQEP